MQPTPQSGAADAERWADLIGQMELM